MNFQMLQPTGELSNFWTTTGKSSRLAHWKNSSHIFFDDFGRYARTVQSLEGAAQTQVEYSSLTVLHYLS
jgi:hypothetical protein